MDYSFSGQDFSLTSGGAGGTALGSGPGGGGGGGGDGLNLHSLHNSPWNSSATGGGNGNHETNTLTAAVQAAGISQV